VRLNSGNKSLCLLCLFIVLHACISLEHISRVWCRSTSCWGSCKFWVDKQACLIPVHNLFSYIYIWASLIFAQFDSPLTGRTIRTFSWILWISRSIRKNIWKLRTWFNSCEKVCDFSGSAIHPPSSRHLDPFTSVVRRAPPFVVHPRNTARPLQCPRSSPILSARRHRAAFASLTRHRHPPANYPCIPLAPPLSPPSRAPAVSSTVPCPRCSTLPCLPLFHLQRMEGIEWWGRSRKWWARKCMSPQYFSLVKLNRIANEGSSYIELKMLFQKMRVWG
jgi:hypothetical protein